MALKVKLAFFHYGPLKDTGLTREKRENKNDTEIFLLLVTNRSIVAIFAIFAVFLFYNIFEKVLFDSTFEGAEIGHFLVLMEDYSMS